MEMKWSTSVDKKSGWIVIVVTLGDRVASTSLSPYSYRIKTPQEMQRLISRLTETIKLQAGVL
jgi:hypothetical protein